MERIAESAVVIHEADQLPRILLKRTSENSLKAKFAEFPFHALG
jgi:hypothetical protein